MTLQTVVRTDVWYDGQGYHNILAFSSKSAGIKTLRRTCNGYYFYGNVNGG